MKNLQYICIFAGIVLTAIGTLSGIFDESEALMYTAIFVFGALVTTCQKDII